MNDATDATAASDHQWNWKAMRKSDRDSKIAGVCGGFGEHTPVPSWMWRVFFLTTLCCGGAGLVAYIVLWICMPAADGQR